MGSQNNEQKPLQLKRMQGLEESENAAEATENRIINEKNGSVFVCFCDGSNSTTLRECHH
jgi:hypothetical protein